MDKYILGRLLTEVVLKSNTDREIDNRLVAKGMNWVGKGEELIALLDKHGYAITKATRNIDLREVLPIMVEHLENRAKKFRLRANGINLAIQDEATDFENPTPDEIATLSLARKGVNRMNNRAAEHEQCIRVMSKLFSSTPRQR